MLRRGLLIALLGIACGGNAEERPPVGNDAASANGGGGRGLDGGAGASGIGGRSGSGGTGVAPDSAASDVSDLGDAAAGDAAESGVEDARMCTAPDTAASIPATLCAAVVALPCRPGYEMAACLADVEAAIAESGEQGCGCQVLAMLECGSHYPLICPEVIGGFDDDIHLNPACAQVEDDHQRCRKQGDGCSFGIEVGGNCRVVCDQHAADCERTDQGLDCTCSYGPKLGVRFSATACADPAIASNCR